MYSTPVHQTPLAVIHALTGVVIVQHQKNVQIRIHRIHHIRVHRLILHQSHYPVQTHQVTAVTRRQELLTMQQVVIALQVIIRQHLTQFHIRHRLVQIA